eukprot:RCo008623
MGTCATICAVTEQGLRVDARQSGKIAAGLRPGELFQDSEFPPCDASLGYEEGKGFSFRGTPWRRATELFPSVVLFNAKGPSHSTVVQGDLADCWLISALAIINPVNLVVGSYPKQGLYEFRFFKEGQWRNVVVDDFLPVRPGPPPHRLRFGHSSIEGELWVCLLEKAYAKLHGSYQALCGGDISYALVDLSGGASEHVWVGSPTGQALAQKGWLLAKMRQCR